MTERARTWRSSQMSTTSFKLTWKKRIVAPNPAAPAYAALLGSCAVNALLRSSPTLQMYMRASGTSVGRPGSVPILAIQDGATRAALGRGEGQFPSVHAAYLAGHTIAIEAAEMWFSAASDIHANRFKKGELVADQPYRFGVRARTVGSWSSGRERPGQFLEKQA